MKSPFEKRLADWHTASGADVPLAGGRKGIEKEALRVTPNGVLSQAPHPAALGSALTSRYITTDFSEALLEFVTPAFEHTWETLRSICDVHQFTYQNLGDELLWPASMPCRIPGEAQIPLARYGNSNVGTMKTVYRRGLGHRYGRSMQTIAGVHFNYSLPSEFWPAWREWTGDEGSDDDLRSRYYMALVRNLRRRGWLLLYLFGASPALCRSFAAPSADSMQVLNEDTWFEPYGTSLRMSDLGYSNKNQSRINVGLNSLEDYIRDLSAAIRTPEPDYEKFGLVVNGEYQQLSTNLLQIENEYYSTVRPKRVARSGERPTAALRRGGIEYVEVRALDINIFDPAGINQNTMRFVEAFLLYCLLDDSPSFDVDGLEEAKRNQSLVARRGRDPSLVLQRFGEAISLRDWADEIVANVEAVAELIDAGERGESYRAAARSMRELIADPAATPSARVLDDLRGSGSSFFEFALNVALGHRDYFANITPLSEATAAEFEREAAASHARQKAVEEADEISFDDYLARYFAAE